MTDEMKERAGVSIARIGTVGGKNLVINQQISTSVGTLAGAFYSAMPQFMEKVDEYSFLILITHFGEVLLGTMASMASN